MALTIEQRLEALERALAARAAAEQPTSYYTSRYTGEEIDERLDAAGVLGKVDTPQKALANIGGRPRKNLLRNWYFAGGGSQQGGGQFPINQLGETSYSDGMAIDKWLGFNGAQITLISSNVQLQGQQESYSALIQKLSNYDEFLNKMITVSVLTDHGLYSASAKNAPSSAAVTAVAIGDSGRLQFQNENGTELSYVIIANSGKTINIIAAKLEVGEGQTLAYQDSTGAWQLFETPDYLETLQQCQRYLYLQPLQYGSFAGYLSSSATEVFFSVPVGVQMAKTLNISYDSVTIFNESGIIFNTQNGGVFTPSAIMPDGNSVYVRASLGAAVGTANQCVACQIAGLTITGTD